MSQHGRPSADSFMTDVWAPSSGGACYAMLNESSQDGDTTYIVATLASGVTPETIPAVKLSSLTDPQVDTGFVTQYYVRKESGANWTASFGLYQGNPNTGGTLLDSWTATITTTSYSLRMRNHSDTVCGNISDYTNLYLSIGGSTASSSVVRATYVDFVIPDAPASTLHRRTLTGGGL